MNKIISFDVSKDTVDVYNLEEKKSSKIKNTYTDLEKFINENLECMFVYEATGVYSSTVQRVCNDLEVKHLFLHPLDSAKLFSSLLDRNKNDSLDAKQLAQLTQLLFSQKELIGKDKFIKPSSNSIAITRSLASQIRYYKDQIKTTNQRIEKLTNDAFAPKGEIKILQEDNKKVEKRIDDLELQIIKFFEEIDILKKYESILTMPSIGQTVAIEMTIFFLTLTDKGIQREEEKKMLAYSGLNPQQRQSGSSINSSTISKKGDKHIRTALYMPAVQRFKRYKKPKYEDTTLGKFAKRMIDHFGSTASKRGKSVASAVSHKLLTIGRAIFHTETEYNRL